jgi:hypothetical protein
MIFFSWDIFTTTASLPTPSDENKIDIILNTFYDKLPKYSSCRGKAIRDWIRLLACILMSNLGEWSPLPLQATPPWYHSLISLLLCMGCQYELECLWSSTWKDVIPDHISSFNLVICLEVMKKSLVLLSQNLNRYVHIQSGAPSYSIMNFPRLSTHCLFSRTLH